MAKGTIGPAQADDPIFQTGFNVSSSGLVKALRKQHEADQADLKESIQREENSMDAALMRMADQKRTEAQTPFRLAQARNKLNNNEEQS